MSLGSWDPNTKQAKSLQTVDSTLLQRFIQLSENECLDRLAEEFNSEELQNYAGLMQLPPETWQAETQHLSDHEIQQLMRFFTKAEQLPGWEAAEKSPVIWLGKVLKQRGTGISRELVLWIKSHSDNRFLPHGALL